MGRLFYSAKPITKHMHPKPLDILLETAPNIIQERGHDLKLYLAALRNTELRALYFLTAGTDSVVFDRGNEIVKITAKKIRDEYGLRPFDLPITEKTTIEVREGVVITVFTQPRAVMDCLEQDTTYFRLDIERLGYRFIDYGMHQIGRYQDKIKLVDPFAVRKHNCES